MHRFLEHKADVLFEATGESFEDAVEECAQALFETMADVSRVKSDESVVVEARAPDLRGLAVFILEELLSEADAENLFFHGFKVASFKKEGSQFVLKGAASGSRRRPEFGRTDVKAVTHHESNVKKTVKGYKIRILLDV
jgi:SHS2 domain-containing protein